MLVSNGATPTNFRFRERVAKLVRFENEQFAFKLRPTQVSTYCAIAAEEFPSTLQLELADSCSLLKVDI